MAGSRGSRVRSSRVRGCAFLVCARSLFARVRGSHVRGSRALAIFSSVRGSQNEICISGKTKNKWKDTNERKDEENVRKGTKPEDTARCKVRMLQ